MPIGSKHDETGLLLNDARNLVLERDAGGTWRLDPTAKPLRLVGRRVRVQGIRDGFDLLAITRIEPI